MKHKLFKIIYSDGSRGYIVSNKGWVGLIPLIDATDEKHRESMFLGEATIFEVIKYIIKGE